MCGHGIKDGIKKTAMVEKFWARWPKIGMPTR